MSEQRYIILPMNRSLLLTAVLAIAACNNPDALTFEDELFLRNMVPFTPAAARTLWNEVEACSGLKGDFDAVRWFKAPDGIKRRGAWVAAIWRSGSNEIIISPPYLGDPRTIKHEEMHALLRGGVDHPHHYFVDGPCGYLMMGPDPTLN
jgi:hypothetical protein